MSPERGLFMTDLVFTKSEVQNVADYFNFVHENARFDVTAKEAAEYSTMATNMFRHIRKCESYIMELKEVVPAPKPAPAPVETAPAIEPVKARPAPVQKPAAKRGRPRKRK